MTEENVVLLRRAHVPPGKYKAVKVIDLRADDTMTLLAQADCLGVYLYDRRSGGKHHLLSWEQIEQLHQQVILTRGGAA